MSGGELDLRPIVPAMIVAATGLVVLLVQAFSPKGKPTPSAPLSLAGLLAALVAFTINAAFLNKHEDRTGSIEVGKLADLIDLDQNVFEIDPADISETRVLLTLFEGETVHGDLNAL